MTSHLQAKAAFIDDPEHVGFFVLAEHGEDEAPAAAVRLAPIGEGEEECWVVPDTERLRRVLARTDLTRVRGLPLVVANPARRILGIAAGPPRPPSQVQVLAVYDLEREVLAAGDDGQPEWWLLDGWPHRE